MAKKSLPAEISGHTLVSELPPEIAIEQLGTAIESEPQVARLILPSKSNDDDGSEPGIPTAPFASAEGPVPRTVHENERVPPGSGLVRFKLRVRNYSQEYPQPRRYVLASSLEQAKSHYLATTGLGRVLDRLLAEGNLISDPQFVVTTLAD